MTTDFWVANFFESKCPYTNKNWLENNILAVLEAKNVWKMV